MSDKIDWRELTRNFLRGEAEDDTPDMPVADEEVMLLQESTDRRLLIVREAARLKNTFNSAELDLLAEEITRF